MTLDLDTLLTQLEAEKVAYDKRSGDRIVPGNKVRKRTYVTITFDENGEAILALAEYIPNT